MRLDALAQASGLHPNTLREHLDGLIRRGLVTREQPAVRGRGRPAWLYRATSDDVASTPEYAGLASALAATLARTSPEPDRVADLAGRDWGAQLAAERGARGDSSGQDARRAVVDLLDELGFDPTSTDDHTRVRLRACPLLDAAQQYPEVVCAVHRGLASGALDTYAREPHHDVSLLPFAEPGACVLDLTSLSAAPDDLTDGSGGERR